MSRRKLKMRQIREILRYHFEHGLSNEKIGFEVLQKQEYVQMYMVFDPTSES
ncbi:hypothetical protein CALK_2131 [Chitinivibrio alkaliphilus ACht1]|uniref:Uncharacterized protein n=1 Tax=Chitinivibrio alkaliphilus ACht1 TaxID=1313304 RepID=U7D3B2_9BACT|nr:hypothetical protein CALK_2131 [Chitinivibrio alkaliphilus ACht1]